LNGCTGSLSNLENPKVLNPGEVSSRIGTTFPGNPTPSNDVALNIGVIRRVEVAAKTDLQSFTFALRYQLIDTPYVTLSLSKIRIVSKIVTNENESNPDGALWVPSLLIGRDHWYLGIKPAYSTFTGYIKNSSPLIIFESNKWNSITLIGGAIIRAGYVNFLLEINDYFSRPGSPILIPAIGVSKVF